MNQMDGWMRGTNGWMGGDVWLWTVIVLLVVILLGVLINKASRK